MAGFNKSPRALAARILGYAVHPYAVDRLFEVWPEAQVEVRHDRVWRGIPFKGNRRQLRRTVVEIWEGEKNPKPLPKGQKPNHRHVTRQAICAAEDTFERAKGIDIAFRRALREAVRRTDPARVSGFKRTL